MILSNVLFAVLPLLGSALAQHNQPAHIRHRRVAADFKPIVRNGLPVERAQNMLAPTRKGLKKRVVKKRTCAAKSSVSSSSSDFAVTSVAVQDTSSAASASSTTLALGAEYAQAAKSSGKKHGNKSATSTSATASATSSATWSDDNDYSSSAVSSTTSAAASATPSSKGSSSSSGLLVMNDPTCGSSDSTSDAPNGSEDWLNCGIDGAGWTPPPVTIDDLVVSELSENGAFKNCAAYFDLFEKHASANGLKPIQLAAIAMQESSCNANSIGENGEIGMMQLIPDNCGTDSSTCIDPDYNIGKGAEILAGYYKDSGNNILLAIGMYNGWQAGMTRDYATRMQSTACYQQNNLDYIHQTVNGWYQNKEGYLLGTIKNLAMC